MKDYDCAAFPQVRIEDNPAAFRSGGSDLQVVVTEGGMSLRDWFAGQALAGFLSKQTEGTFSKVTGAHRAAIYAYEYADAMLAARAKE